MGAMIKKISTDKITIQSVIRSIKIRTCGRISFTGVASILIFLQSCIKEQVSHDFRDRIVGTYEVWEYFYYPDSMGNSVPDGIFHYPKIEITKNQVTFTNKWGDKIETEGLSYFPLITGPNDSTKHGIKDGFWQKPFLFTVSEGPPIQLGDLRSGIFDDYSGTFRNDTIFLSGPFDIFSGSGQSAIAVRIK
jgi:hypothetical protein